MNKNGIFERVHVEAEQILKEIKKKNDDDIPESEVHIAEDGEINTIKDKNPSEVVYNYIEYIAKEVREIAEMIVESDEFKEENPVVLDRDSDSVFGDYDNIIWDPTREQQIQQVQEKLAHCIARSTGYADRIEYVDEGIKKTLKRTFPGPNEEFKEKKHIAPIINFKTESERIELSIDEYPGTDKGHPISFEISEITKEDVAAILNAKSNALRESTILGGRSTDHVIRIKENSLTHASRSDKFISDICTALRLFQPKSAPVQAGRSFHLIDERLSYKYGIDDYGGGGPVEFPLAFPRPKEPYELEQATEFREFWERYHGEIGYDNSKLARPISRFNSTYSKEDTEDRILDTSIAFESTILRDTGKQASINFRLKLRGAVLLDKLIRDSQEDIMTFFDDFYETRGEIVHKDIPVEDQGLDYDTDRRESGFVLKSRNYLANLIRLYMEMKLERGISITEVNQLADEVIQELDGLESLSEDWTPRM